ncbi:MAG: hypothetical protein F9K40_18085 [Kofleriaceae bacterium]|nr:MAG: hypothetical protein F9K40_18085 [Kofleriaceae bacterium]MBZ0231164.1 hypothetical protein [Kofleriaceae bacterium]
MTTIALAAPAVLALEKRSNAELEEVFLRGATPALSSIAGWEWRGLNTPPWFRLLGIKKFIKGFYKDASGQVWGYNCPVEQNGLREPWIARPDDANPRRFGFYTVSPVDPTARDNRYLHALLLDYGKGKNPRLDPSAGLRDYLVQVDARDPDVLLGKAYYAAGPLRLPTFSFFILERHRRAPDTIVR